MADKILIVDYGMGNLHSVSKKLYQLGCAPIISSDPKELDSADKIILPGVGHFQQAMQNLQKLNLIDALHNAVQVKMKPILGICLGMQLMAKKSEEGNAEGLGWFDANVVKFKVKNSLKFKIPQVGWNQVQKTKPSLLMKDIPEAAEFYFVHSYHMNCEIKADILNETEYEYIFTSAVEKSNIFGVQYHPEKSHDVGKTLLNNFLQITNV